MEPECVAGFSLVKIASDNLADVDKFKNSEIDKEIAMAKKEEEERRRKLVPMPPEQEAELKAWVANTQKDIAGRDLLRQQQMQQQQ